MKISVLGGAGGIGQPLSLLLKNGLPAGSELALYDVNPMVVGVGVAWSEIPADWASVTLAGNKSTLINSRATDAMSQYP